MRITNSIALPLSGPEVRSPTFRPSAHSDVMQGRPASPAAIVYCEGNLGAVDGKTANGLIRESGKYKILAVIDSEKAGRDAGVVLDGRPNGIRVYHDLAQALSHCGGTVGHFIYGMAPGSGRLTEAERRLLLGAMELGMNLVVGLHEFLSDDPEFIAASVAANVLIDDVRKPPAKKDLRIFSDRIGEVTCPRIAVLGTDCAIGKRTTATILTRALNEAGIRAVMIGTGQTGLIQGARYGVALDAIPSQFCSGELEATVLEAFETEHPDVIVVEGQGALGHPALSTSAPILRGCRPDGVVLQHAPARKVRCDFARMSMPSADMEIHLIETFADTRVIGLTLNHENMTDAEMATAIVNYEFQLGLPTTDALTRPAHRLVDMVTSAFPQLACKLNASE